MLKAVCLLILAILFIVPTLDSQGLGLPPPNDPWWKTPTGALFVYEQTPGTECVASMGFFFDDPLTTRGFAWCGADGKMHERSYPENRPLPKTASFQCLVAFPPDEAGERCLTTGYSSESDERKFEAMLDEAQKGK